MSLKPPKKQPVRKWKAEPLAILLEWFPIEGQRGVRLRLQDAGYDFSYSTIQYAWKRYGSPVKSPQKRPGYNVTANGIRVRCAEIRQEHDHEGAEYWMDDDDDDGDYWDDD